jgi:uncharacterized membrane protein
MPRTVEGAVIADEDRPGRSERKDPPAVVAAPDPAPAIAEARVRLRAPWAASIAGLLFAVFFSVGLVLIRNSPLIGSATDSDLARLLGQGEDWWLLVGSLYLLPFSGIMFLWFMAVIRDQIGDREDQFFATVFFGSGLLFVASLFATAAVCGSLVVSFRYLRLGPPTATEVDLVRALAYTLAFAISTRAAAVFLISLGTVGLRSGVFPRWFAFMGYLFGIVLMIIVTIWDWVVLVLPLWVAIVSIFILRRERDRRNADVARRPSGSIA